MKKLYVFFTMCLFSYSFLFAQVGIEEKCVNCKANSINNTSSALGIQNTASGEASFASGKLNMSLGDYSTSLGYGNNAEGRFSLAGGEGCSATGKRSLAFGRYASAESSISLALGSFIRAYGTNAIAMGCFVETTGENAVVIGRGLANDARITNNISGSLMVGFNSNRHTFFVSQAYGLNSTGEIGIGNVTDPSAKLHIVGDSDYLRPNDASLYIESAGNYYSTIWLGDKNHFIKTKPGQDLEFNAAGQDFFFNNGNVGIGTSSPDEKLEVAGTIKATTFSGDGSLLTNLTGDNLGSHIATQNINLNGKYLSGDGTNKGVFVNALGNVGIGTNAPSQKLQIADGDIFIEDIDRGIIMKSPDGNCWRGTVNNSGLLEFAQIDCSTFETGINSAGASNIPNVKIYPNPAGNQVFITADTKTQLTLQINDISGRLISSQQLNNAESYIDLSGYPSGVYLFKLTDVQGNHIFSQKVIKE
jgi:hypothetical protein